MTVSILLLLAFAVAGAVTRPRGVPAWVAPVVAAGTALAAGLVPLDEAHHAMSELADPLAFLLAAVPMAVLLDHMGFFTVLAARVAREHHLVAGLWFMAAGVTAVLNLDAAVVLLTPLYVRIARRSGLPVMALALQPVLLALLASSLLPVSNLTNLIVVSHAGVSTADFLVHMGLPTVAAVAVGFAAYRRLVPAGARRPAARPPADPGATRALWEGGAVVGVALVGFLGGRYVGIQPWHVAVAADLALMALTPRIPWRAVPWGTALVAAGLGVLAAGAAAHLPVSHLVSGHSFFDLLRTAGAFGVAANLVNNLPALLLALPHLPRGSSPQLWAVLLGVNMGPSLVITGSLASLLWLDSVRRFGVRARPADYLGAGLRVVVPAMAAGAVVMALLAA